MGREWGMVDGGGTFKTNRDKQEGAKKIEVLSELTFRMTPISKAGRVKRIYKLRVVRT